MLYSVKIVFVDSRDISREGGNIGRKLGVDRHLGSAYTITKRTLKYLHPRNSCILV